MPAEAPQEASDQPASQGHAPSRVRSLSSKLGAWLSRLGLRAPALHRESKRLLRRSKELHALALQVGMATRVPEDGAPLLRKAIYVMFAAVLRLDDKKVTSYDDCRERLLASPEHKELFADVLEELPFLDELVTSFEPASQQDGAAAERYRALLKRMSGMRKKVRKYYDKRLEEAGAHPMLGRIVLASAIVLGAALVFVLAYSAPSGLKADRDDLFEPSTTVQVQPPPEVPQAVRDDPLRCFKATFYADPKFETLVDVRRDCHIAFDWGDGSPGGIQPLPPEGFSVRWEGLLKAPASDEYTFYLTSDDGSRLFVGDELVVDNWGDHNILEVRGSIKLREGEEYPIRVEYYESGGLAQVQLMWSSSSFDKKTLSGRHIRLEEPVRPPSRQEAHPEPDEVLTDTSKCFTGRYFTGTAFETLVRTRRDCRIDFDWAEGAADGIDGLDVDSFSVRWEGTLRVPETADYVFYLASDDGSRLYIDNELIVGDWSEHGFGDLASRPTKLEQGTDYPIRVEYFEVGGLAQIRLHWSSPTMSRRPLSGRHITPASPSVDAPH